MNLLQLGFSDTHWVKERENSQYSRITSVHRGVYKGFSEQGEITLYLPGKYLHSDVAVGDFCLLKTVFTDQNNRNAGIIEDILPRKSKISRRSAGTKVQEQILAANIDYAFIVTSANDDFSINRLQRYVILCKNGSVSPVIVMSKTDLSDNLNTLISEIKDRMEDIPIICTSIAEVEGLQKIKALLIKEGATGVFLGSSGVGKSTLVNRLLQKESQVTKEIREKDSKGQHTTTNRELFFLDGGGMIIDTPGLREVQLIASKEDIHDTFKSLRELEKSCKFSNCSHTTEPGCQVSKGISDGTIESADLKNYDKMLKEIEFNERKMNKELSANTKKKWKTINQNSRKKRNFLKKP